MAKKIRFFKRRSQAAEIADAAEDDDESAPTAEGSQDHAPRMLSLDVSMPGDPSVFEEEELILDPDKIEEVSRTPEFKALVEEMGVDLSPLDQPDE